LKKKKGLSKQTARKRVINEKKTQGEITLKRGKKKKSTNVPGVTTGKKPKENLPKLLTKSTTSMPDNPQRLEPTTKGGGDKGGWGDIYQKKKKA